MAYPNLESVFNWAHSFRENFKSHHFATVYKSCRSCSYPLAMFVTADLAVTRCENSLLGQAGQEINKLFIRYKGHNKIISTTNVVFPVVKKSSTYLSISRIYPS